MLNLFVSCAPQDNAYRDDFIKHLANLRRSGKINIWSENQIEPGVDWNEHSRAQLRQADLVALLISGDFMNSDKIWENELKQSLDRRKKGDAVMLIPILIKPCQIENTILGKIQRLPRDHRAVSSYTNKDEAWYKIAVEISALIDNFPKSVAAAMRSVKTEFPDGNSQQIIGNKNVISGSVIIVGRDLNIGDVNATGSGKKENTNKWIAPHVNLENLIKGYLDSMPSPRNSIEGNGESPVEIHNTFIGGQHQHNAPNATGFQAFSGTQEEYDRILLLLNSLKDEEKDSLKKEINEPIASLHDREKSGYQILSKLQKSMLWLNSNSEEILKNVTASMYFEAVKTFFGS